MTIEISLTQGQVAYVDGVDGDLAELKWSAMFIESNQSFYAYRKNRENIGVLMHRVILSRKLGRDLKRNELVDHINLDTLDNRRENLRLATMSQNMSNRGKQENNTSGYKGVYWRKDRNKWMAAVRINGKNKYLGDFTDIEDAAEAYRLGAIKYHGEFARWTEEGETPT